MLEVILWGCAFLIASIPVSVGIMIIGATLLHIKRDWQKTTEQVEAEKLAKKDKRN